MTRIQACRRATQRSRPGPGRSRPGTRASDFRDDGGRPGESRPAGLYQYGAGMARAGPCRHRTGRVRAAFIAVSRPTESSRIVYFADLAARADVPGRIERARRRVRRADSPLRRHSLN